MLDIVEKRILKFKRFMDLREKGKKALTNEALPARERILELADPGSFEEFMESFPEIDPLLFRGYPEKKKKLRAKTGEAEALVSGRVRIQGYPAVIAVMDKRFLMGSLGIELGERITRAVEAAQAEKLPLIIFTASGGARMQEGVPGLFQMAKTAAAIEAFKAAGGLYIAVLTHPTTGGVSASFATLGDITLAEPKALIGFAGPRVIRQTIGEKLPEGFQRAEFLETHGFLDAVVPRQEMRAVLGKLLKLHERNDESD